MLGSRVPAERPGRPFTGFKLAHAVVSADGRQAGFGGLSIGAHLVYGRVAEARCGWNRRHAPPRRRCGCGFYCLHSLAEARGLACATEYRAAVLLEITASGRFIRYERGLRYSRQRVLTVRAGPCGCGRPAAVLADAGRGIRGWRYLTPSCAACAAGRHFLTFGGFARRLGGPVAVGPDTGAGDWAGSGNGATAGEPARAGNGATAAAAGLAGPGEPAEAGLARPREPAEAGVDGAAAIAALSAEITLVHARLDHVQAQLSRLQGGPAAGDGQ